MRAKDALGRYGENVALRHLTEAGLVVLARNWRCPLGEVDLVAREGDTLVLCEVKTRRDDAHGGPLAAVNAAKLDRLRRLAECWLDSNGWSGEIRVDVVGVWASRAGSARVEHVRGVLWG